MPDARRSHVVIRARRHIRLRVGDAEVAVGDTAPTPARPDIIIVYIDDVPPIDASVWAMGTTPNIGSPSTTA